MLSFYIQRLQKIQPIRLVLYAIMLSFYHNFNNFYIYRDIYSLCKQAKEVQDMHVILVLCQYIAL